MEVPFLHRKTMGFETGLSMEITESTQDRLHSQINRIERANEQDPTPLNGLLYALSNNQQSSPRVFISMFND